MNTVIADIVCGTPLPSPCPSLQPGCSSLKCLRECHGEPCNARVQIFPGGYMACQVISWAPLSRACLETSRDRYDGQVDGSLGRHTGREASGDRRSGHCEAACRLHESEGRGCCVVLLKGPFAANGSRVGEGTLRAGTIARLKLRDDRLLQTSQLSRVSCAIFEPPGLARRP